MDLSKKTAKKRDGNIELLRLLSMCMVIILHAMDKGHNLVSLYEADNVTKWVAWLLESFSVCAVNVFMLISGYFCVKSRFRIGKMIDLVCQTIFYSFGAFLVCRLFHIGTADTGIYDYLKYIFPVHMNLYWFVTVYIVIYMLSPLLNKAINNMSKEQLGRVIVLLLVCVCIFKSVLPVRLEADGRGNNFLWLLIVYIIGAYFRLYGFKHLTNVKRSLMCYILCSLLIFAEVTAIYYVIGLTGHLKEITNIPRDYNHIFALASAVGMFAIFINKKPMGEKTSSLICKLSPMALGIYLIHENMSFRYNWQQWLGVYEISKMGICLFLIKLLCAILAIVFAGLLVDFVRIKLFSLVSAFIDKTGLREKMNNFDNKINGIQ